MSYETVQDNLKIFDRTAFKTHVIPENSRVGPVRENPINQLTSQFRAQQPTAAMIVLAEAFRKLGSQLATRSSDKLLDQRLFISFYYGTSPDVLADCWEPLEPNRNKYPRP